MTFQRTANYVLTVCLSSGGRFKNLFNRLEKLSQTILRYQAKLVQSQHRD